MAATLLVMAARDRPLLPRPEGVRRGRHADGGEGMKIAVIGGGSTYTPELVSGLSRERDRIDVRELVLHDIDAERREVVGGMARAHARARRASAALLDVDRRPRPRASTAPTSCCSRSASAGRRRASRTRRSRSRCGCIGQETTGAGGFAKALRTVPVVLDIAERVARARRAGAWIVDFTNPVGIVTRALLDAGHRAVGLCNVAIGFQRAFARAARRRARARRRRPGRPQPPHLDPRRARSTARTCSPSCSPSTATSSPPRSAAARGCSSELGVDPVLLPALLLRARRGARRAARRRRRARRRWPRSSASCSRCTATRRSTRSRRCSSSAAARSTARRRPALVASLAAGDGDVHVVDVRNGGTLAGLADDDVVEVPARIERGGPVPLPQAPLAPELLGLVAARGRLRAAGGRARR